MIVLWAMSLWLGAIILGAAGFGLAEFETYGVKRRYLLPLCLAIWVMGWLSAVIFIPHWRINLGFAAFALAAWGFLLWSRNTHWQTAALFLALLAAVVRLVAPFSFNQASVLPEATLESVGLGLSAGVILGKPGAASLVGAAAEALSAIFIGFFHGRYHVLGRHDLAVVMIVALSAWAAGWVVSDFLARLGRPA